MDRVSLLIACCTVGIAWLVMCVPTLAMPIARGTSVMLGSVARRPGRAATAFGVGWSLWLLMAFTTGHRAAAPHIHDEFAYLLQARMLAEGHLWLPSPAQPDFFDSFHILVRPVYASKYPPGTALFYVPAMWLHLHWMTTSIVIAGASFGLIGYLAVRLIGPWTMPVCFAAASTSGTFVALSTQALSQPPLVALAAVAWLMFVFERDRHRTRWFAIAGVATGWAFIVRPVDAPILIGPPLAMLLWRAGRLGRGTVVRAAAIVVAGALPFLALMLYANHGITGSWTRTAWGMYASIYQPGEHVGFGAPEFGTLPPGLPQQKYDYYNGFARPAMSAHHLGSPLASWLGGARSQIFCDVVLGPAIMWLLLPLGAIGLAFRRLWPLALSLAATIALYTLYPFSGSQYFYGSALIVWLAAAAAVAALIRRRPVQQRPVLRGGVMLALVIVVAFSRLPLLLNWRSWPTDGVAYEAHYFEEDVLRKVRAPAIVFVRYGEGSPLYHDERVYNIETARPEQAAVMRVHSLGARNVDLLRSVRAERATSRVYLYDRRSYRLADLGTIDDAIRMYEAASTTSRPTTTPAEATSSVKASGQ